MGMWPGIFAVLGLYGFLAALAPDGWDEPLVLLGIGFASLSGYAWLDPARRRPTAGARALRGAQVVRLGVRRGGRGYPSEEDTSHPRFGRARRPAYREWRVAPGLQGPLETWTADSGEVMIWVATEDEYGAAGGKVGELSAYRGP